MLICSCWNGRWYGFLTQDGRVKWMSLIHAAFWYAPLILWWHKTNSTAWNEHLQLQMKIFFVWNIRRQISQGLKCAVLYPHAHIWVGRNLSAVVTNEGLCVALQRDRYKISRQQWLKLKKIPNKCSTWIDASLLYLVMARGSWIPFISSRRNGRNPKPAC